MRTVTAALVGALCGAGWYGSLEPTGEFLCRESGLGCVVSLILLVVPALVVVWGAVGWGLLKVARFPRAWLTALVGTAGAVMLLLISSYSLKFVEVRLPEDAGVLVVAIAAAGGYALATVVTAGYGVRRDGTEHRGQDG